MKSTSLILLALIIFSSCRKNDDIPPALEVTSPSKMSYFEYGDVVTVNGSASDETALKSVKIELLNANQAATTFSFEIIASSDVFDFNKSFELDDRHLSSGTYYLKVSAIDKAGNRESDFIELNYGELPKELTGIALIDQVSPSVYDFYFHNFIATDFMQSFTGDFQSLLADSYNLLIWFSGGSSGNLITYDLENDLINWQKSPQPSFYPCYSKLHQMNADHNIAVVKGNGTVVTMDKEGITNRTFNMNLSSAEGGEILQHNDYILIEERASNNHYLSLFVKSTGSYVNKLQFSEDIIGIQKRNDDEVFVITSGNNNCHLYLYDYLNSSTYEPHSIDPGILYDFCVVDANEIILAHSTGLLRYTVSNNSMVTISSEVATQLEYESLSGAIYANVNNNIKIFDHLGNTGGTVVSGVNVSEFALYYNK